MSIETTLERIAVALETLAAQRPAAVEAANYAAVIAAGTPPAAETPAKRGRPRKTATPVAPVEETKAEVLAAAAVEAEAAQVAETATRVASSFLDEDTANDEPSKDDVRSVLIRVQEKFSKDRAFALLQEFKAPSLNQLDLANYRDIIAAGKALLG